MQVVSVNVGMPRQLTWKGKTLTTGIFKEPVAGPVAVRKHNLGREGLSPDWREYFEHQAGKRVAE